VTTKSYAELAAQSFPIDAATLALAARYDRDAYVADLLARGARKLTNLVGGWLRRRRAIAELQQLDARLMADIGLDRAAFAAGVIRRMDEDRAQAVAMRTPAAPVRPVTRHAAEPHLAPMVTPAAANESRRAA
jgi:uncharacterized protein YjiS (DUF1127 family)